MSAVWKNGPERQSQRFVLLSLADQANDAGHCWPSYAKTAVRCCMNRRSVMRIIQQLEDEDWLRRETRYVTGGLHTSNGFWLNLTKLFNGDTGSPHGDTETPLDSDTGSPRGDSRSPKPSRNPNIQTDNTDDEFQKLLDEFGIDANKRTLRLAGQSYITREFLSELVDEAERKGLEMGWVVTQMEKPPRAKPVKLVNCRICLQQHPVGECAYLQEVGR